MSCKLDCQRRAGSNYCYGIGRVDVIPHSRVKNATQKTEKPHWNQKCKGLKGRVLKLLKGTVLNYKCAIHGIQSEQLFCRKLTELLVEVRLKL